MGDLSQHFARKEFSCPCCGAAEISAELVACLEALRELVEDSPVRVLSGYRCKRRNEKVGGAANSRHMMGDAADIVVPGMTLREVFYAATSVFGHGGIGVYPSGGFLHVDLGPRRRWGYIQGQGYVPFVDAWTVLVGKEHNNEEGAA